MSNKLILLSSIALAFGACKKKEEGSQNTNTSSTSSAAASSEPSSMASSSAMSSSEPAKMVDHITVEAMHTPVKPEDPVKVKLPNFKIVSSEFPSTDNLEGGKATVEVMFSEIDSGNEKRDGHLKSADFVDAEKFEKATGKIMDVKKKGEGYTGQLELTVKDKTKKMPLDFTVAEKSETSVTVEFTAPLKLEDFGFSNADGKVADDLMLSGRLTFTK